MTIKDFLVKKFPDNWEAINGILDLYKQYDAWGLKDRHFETELADGNDQHFYSRLWEMILAKHLKNVGFEVTSRDEGPDFAIPWEGKTIWVEAICPAPRGLPDEWINPAPSGMVVLNSVPHQEILLRLTAALKEKKEKLVGSENRPGYLKKGVVKLTDPYIIALSTCCLGQFPVHDGVSQFPLIVEAVFPVGPIQIMINTTTANVTDTRHAYRNIIKNTNNSAVKTDVFLSRDFKAVSATLSCTAGINAACGYNYASALVHNPLADNKIPVGIFGVSEEYTAEARNDHYELARVR